jgi:hypothetical protein
VSLFSRQLGCRTLNWPRCSQHTYGSPGAYL